MLTHWTALLPQKDDFWDKDGKNGKKVEAMEKGGSNGKKRRKLTSRDAFGCARHLKMGVLHLEIEYLKHAARNLTF